MYTGFKKCYLCRSTFGVTPACYV